MQLGEGTGWINAAIHLPDVKRLVLASALGKLHALDAHTLRPTSSFRLPFVPQACNPLQPHEPRPATPCGLRAPSGSPSCRRPSPRYLRANPTLTQPYLYPYL